jgi:uncharacterized protein (DUF1501 family)
MKRRDFLKNSIPAATVLPALINGYSVKAFNQNSPLVQALMQQGAVNDHVLVIVQLSGGNDGLNMVIPISTYSLYNNARANVAIAENKILKLNGVTETGIHTSMTGVQSLFNDGKAKIIQAVGYPQPNFSHFRATDIWMTSSNSNQEIYTGWAGRYLNYEFPNYPSGYPNASMKDPLAIQIGSTASLTFQGPQVNMGMSITNPTSFYNLISGTSDPVPNTPAGKELSYVRQIAQQTQQYGTVIRAAANAVTQQGPYPANNSLADQLKIVARLVKGGLKTKIFMVSFGGFDTHSVQVNSADTSTGSHATLLQRVSDAIKAFQDDIKGLGIEDKIVGMTFSEFGRRIKSNSSVGTDHGAAAPMILFGNKIAGGMLGVNPTIPTAATVNDNVPMQYDFRSVYATLLEKWFCMPKSVVQSLFPTGVNTTLQDLPLIKAGSCTESQVNLSGNSNISYYPNPIITSTTLRFTVDAGPTLIQIIDTLGRVVAVPLEKDYAAAGTYNITWDAEGFPFGIYYARLQNGAKQQVLPMLKIRG